jgi:hypothetical protein
MKLSVSFVFHFAKLELTSAGFLAYCVKLSVARTVRAYNQKIFTADEFFQFVWRGNFVDVMDIG